MVAQRAGPGSLTEVHDETGNGRLCPTSEHEIEREADGYPRDHDHVGPENGSVQRRARPFEAGQPGDEQDDRKGNAPHGRRQARPALRAGSAKKPPRTDDEDDRREHDCGLCRLADIRNRRDHVREHHGGPLGPPLETPARVRQEGLHEQPPMEGEEESAEVCVAGPARSSERAQVPGQARQREEEARPALRSPGPGHDPAADEDQPDDEIRDGEPDLGCRGGFLEWPAPQRRPLGVEAQCDARREERDANRAH